MRSSDRDRQGVAPRLFHKTHRIVRIRIDNGVRTAFRITVRSPDRPKFPLNGYSKGMCQLTYFLCDRHILFKRQRRCIDHYRSKSCADCFYDRLPITVVQMDTDRKLRFIRPVNTHLYEALALEFQLVGMDRQDHRRVQLFASIHDAVKDLSCTDIKCRYCKIVFLRCF